MVTTAPETPTTAYDMPDIYLPEPATLTQVWVMTATEKFFRIETDTPRPTPYLPGQFLELSVPGIGECPISISSSPSRTDPGTFEVVVRDAGSVTHALHHLEPGDKIGMRGPFGTHFPVTEAMRGKDVIFICGGIGLVPVRSAIHYVLDHRDDYGDVSIFLGTRSPKERLFTSELFDWKRRDDVFFRETVDTADSSWGGNVGVITTLLPLVRTDPRRTVAVVCGPPIMYRFVLAELRQMQFSSRNIYVSLERHMKCGVGKCGHCQIEGFYACQEGPVFNYSEILSTMEAI